jgi:hypothetical protein
LKVRTLKLDLMVVDPTFELSVYSEEPNRPDTILIELIGLDGRFRTKRQDFAVVANKGTWVDGATFTLERRFLGQRFLGSNPIRRPRQACRTKCG